MHSTLPTAVLALAPDSLASLGELDNDRLSELWGVFTRCKDSLQNGRRLENLSWRLLFLQGARMDSRSSCPKPGHMHDDLDDERADEIREQAVEDGWSDPEWEETTDSDASSDEGQAIERGRPTSAVSAASAPAPAAASAASAGGTAAPPRPRGRTASVPADSSSATKAAAQAEAQAQQRAPFHRGVSREWKSAPVISGGSLQRMFAELQRLPEIPHPGKARSLHEVDAPTKPPLGSRGSSAPDGLSQASLSRPATPPPAQVDAPTQTTPNRSRRVSPVRSPCMSRSTSTPSHPTTSTSTITVTAPTPAPVPSGAASRRVPSALTMSAMPSPLRSRPVSPPPPSPPPVLQLTPTETAMMALSNSRNQSDANLHRRSQSTAELAASFQPASYIRGFNPSPSSLEAHPRIGAIAPPPTPATKPAALAPSPPLPSKTPTSSPASVVPPSALRSSTTPAKVPPPRPAPPATSAAAPTASSSRLLPPPMKASGGGIRDKKIFFISSPDSDEDHGSSRSQDSCKTKVVVTPPSAAKPPAASVRSAAAAAKGKGKAPVVQLQEEEDNDDAWDSEEDEDDDASSGWGSEYSTDSDIARNAAASSTRTGRSGRSSTLPQQRQQQRPGLDFTKRAPSELQRTASTVSMGQPGELTRRPPGLLSQLFHPEDFLEPDGGVHHSASAQDVVRRNHKSMSALSSLGGGLRASKSAAVLNGARPSMLQARSKSFLRGKPEDVELESSSDEDEDEEHEEQEVEVLSVPVSRDERSSDYEDVDDSQSSSAESAAALLARRQRLAAELEVQAQQAVVAPPQTPRTTRRAMLATELSESLRRNLLWERQMRNRVMGGNGPRRPIAPGQPLPQRPASSVGLVVPPNPPPSAPPTVAQHPTPPPPLSSNSSGTRAPHPTPATRSSPPIASAAAPPPHRSASFVNLPRRHTTGTGLYLAAQTGKWPSARPAEEDSELSESEDEGEDSEEREGGKGAGGVGGASIELFGGRVW
ncbi:hypothetical protein JCM8547_000412 [Rhodosporidiobolus lusitaniae]